MFNSWEIWDTHHHSFMPRHFDSFIHNQSCHCLSVDLKLISRSSPSLRKLEKKDYARDAGLRIPSGNGFTYTPRQTLCRWQKVSAAPWTWAPSPACAPQPDSFRDSGGFSFSKRLCMSRALKIPRLFGQSVSLAVFHPLAEDMYWNQQFVGLTTKYFEIRRKLDTQNLQSLHF